MAAGRRGARGATLARAVALVLALCALARPAAALYTKKGDVELLTEANFEELVLDSGDTWLVEFFAPWCGHCKALAPEWTKAATQLKGSVRVGAVDCDVHKNLAQKYGIKGFPTIKLFGEDKTAAPVDYTGARDAAGIVAYAQAALGAPGGGGTLVRALTYLTTHTFLWQSGTPAVVLLTEGGAKTAPAWLSSLAVKFKEGKTRKLAVGHARAEDEPAIAARFGVTSFPALLAVVPTAAGEGYMVRFEGSLPEKPAAALKEVKAFVDGVLAGDTPEARRAHVPAFPPPDVPRKQADVSYAALSDDNLHSSCFGGKKSMCVLALVAARGGEFTEAAALQELARKYRNDPFSFVWLDAASQPEFTAALGAAEAPALLVIKHGKRPRVAAHGGAITAADVAPFLDRVLGGDVAFKALKELPELMSDAMRDALRASEGEDNTAEEL